MIWHTLDLICSRLNEFIQRDMPRTEAWVVLSNIADQAGQPFDGARDKLVMLLANIQHETTISTFNRTVPTQKGQYAAVTPPVYINLYVLLYANFYDKNYAEGLKFISQVISFFQQNPWFSHDNLPGLDVEIDKLTFEIANLDVTALNHLMGMLGAKYLPSVYYKVRMLPFRGGALQEVVPAAQGYRAPTDPQDSNPEGGE